ncbi:MAG TPA: adenylate/guanylate cyclase domain-containing protein [Magnetospirillum sp.]|jgi:class 3 adenylate cyclase|nr:adenylate/guanylate cyclase domain-containing protein [Magnetospirillum sp.]
MIIVHYEVYVLEGRGWILHARFPRSERETAINEAKEVEHTLNVRVKVVRETYYTDDNAFEEADIYVSGAKAPAPRPQAAQPAPRAPGGGSGGGGNTAGRPVNAPVRPLSRPSSPPPRKRASSPEEIARARQTLSRLLAITAVAVAAALLAIKITPNAVMLLWKIGFTWSLTPDGYNQLLLTVFVGIFLLVSVPLAMRFLPRKTAMPHLRRPDFSLGGAGPNPVSEDPNRDRAIKKSLDKLATQALADEQRGGRRPEDKDADDDEPPATAVPKAAEPKAAVDDLPEIRPSRDDEPLPEIRPDPVDEVKAREEEKKTQEEKKQAEEKKPADKKAKEEKAKEEKKKEAVTAESLQPTVMRFVNGAMAQAKSIAPNMDSYTKFALHLYLAGAVEGLCEFKKLGDSAKAKLVSVALEALGTSADLARKFYEKLEEYLLEPRYLGMVQAGRDAMGDLMLGDEGGGHRAMRDALQEWNRKGDKKAQIVTVMFTDMVGSTDLTQARGDAAAQEVVRRHNSIVRGALAQFGGKEVKHTGDGIMASFTTAAAAVEATISIQRQVDQHNQRLPHLALHLRIGLNAGEPIEEDDDLFGATVQLAARVCAATNADQTLCTSVVKDLTTGKGAASFRPMGEKYLKGFKEAVPLFEVIWQ